MVARWLPNGFCKAFIKVLGVKCSRPITLLVISIKSDFQVTVPRYETITPPPGGQSFHYPVKCLVLYSMDWTSSCN